MFIVSCDSYDINDGQAVGEKIIEIATQSDSDTTYIKITDIIDGDFEQFMFIAPYTNPELFQKETDIDLTFVERTGVRWSDHNIVLTLISDRKVQKIYLLPIQYLRYPLIDWGVVFNSGSTTISVRREQNTYFLGTNHN